MTAKEIKINWHRLISTFLFINYSYLFLGLVFRIMYNLYYDIFFALLITASGILFIEYSTDFYEEIHGIGDD
ncbi:MAG: hypothetical protein QXV17_08210 [Candidatus Micrarchaeaceae archaeon]